MPYLIDKMSISNPKNDKRVKVTQAQKDAIRQEYQAGGISQRGLARKHGVSRRLISFILDPEKAAAAKAQYKERRKDGRYYNKEAHTQAVKRHRDHKLELNSKGLLR